MQMFVFGLVLLAFTGGAINDDLTLLQAGHIVSSAGLNADSAGKDETVLEEKNLAMSIGRETIEKRGGEEVQVHVQASSARQLHGGSAHKTNLCLEGRQLPEIMLIGTQKGATSSLANNFIDAGVEPALMLASGPENECWNDKLKASCTWKESHFFDTTDQWEGMGEIQTSISAVGRQKWLANFPKCTGSRKAIGDLTPDNIALVPVPEGTVMDGGVYGQLLYRHPGHSQVNLAKTIRGLYGHESSRLTFVATLRDFVPRMHSAWYHAQSINFTGVCLDCQGPSFVQSLAGAVVDALSSPPRYQDWLYRSMVGHQLSFWGEAFDAQQFYFVPFQYYVQHGNAALCSMLWQHVGAPLNCTSVAPTQENTFHHPSLAEEPISASLTDSIEKLFSSDRQRLVKLLARMHSQGAHLLGFQLPRLSSGGDSQQYLDAVDSWLMSSW